MDDFERTFILSELLPPRSYPRMMQAIRKMGLDYFEMVDINGQTLFSMGQAVNVDKLALSPELEPIGFILFDLAKKDLAEAALDFILEILQTNWRYQMASSIHIQTTQDDYELLLEKNKLLEASEQRFKTLSENLEERVQVQLKIIEESQRQLYETEKMASVGQLAAGVAHEINNPIGFISSNLHTASEYLDELEVFFAEAIKDLKTESKTITIDEKQIRFLLEDFKELLNESLAGACKVSVIVADLKAFSNVDHSEESFTDLTENVERVARVFLTSVDKQFKLETNIQPLEKTFCKPGHLNQLLLNLLHNSANALGSDALASDGSASDGLINLNCKMENNKILLQVIDNGKGMSEETRRKAFEPFYTTHDVGGGTGLGLTVTRDIVMAHAGEIIVKSQLGEGTCITVLLPIKHKSSP